jgi:hypothetical protein
MAGLRTSVSSAAMEPAYWTGGIGNDFIVDGADVYEIELCQTKIIDNFFLSDVRSEPLNDVFRASPVIHRVRILASSVHALSFVGDSSPPIITTNAKAC